MPRAAAAAASLLGASDLLELAAHLLGGLRGLGEPRLELEPLVLPLGHRGVQDQCTQQGYDQDGHAEHDERHPGPRLSRRTHHLQPWALRCWRRPRRRARCGPDGVGRAHPAHLPRAVRMWSGVGRRRSAARSRTEAARGLAARSASSACSAPRVSSRRYGRCVSRLDRQPDRRARYRARGRAPA